MFGITFKSKTLAFSFKGDLCRGKDTASWLCLGEKSERERGKMEEMIFHDD